MAKTRKIFNTTPRDLHLSARGQSIIVPKKHLAEVSTPEGTRNVFKRGEVAIDEELLGALGEDDIVRHWVTAGELDINGQWPPAPPKPVVLNAPESAIDQQRRVLTAEGVVAGLEQRLANATDLLAAMTAENTALKAENARLLDAATTPPVKPADAPKPADAAKSAAAAAKAKADETKAQGA